MDNTYKAFYQFVAAKLAEGDRMVKNAAEVLGEIKVLVDFVETLGDDRK
jgi:hypothetical protein